MVINLNQPMLFQKEELLEAKKDACSKYFENQYEHKFAFDPFINRQLVSFQANKGKPGYRWYKFKEAFSTSLVEYLLNKYQVNKGSILDPFAGSGTSLFTASNLGLNADGIELLPIGQEIIKSRLNIENHFTNSDRDRVVEWIQNRPWESAKVDFHLTELKITISAYPEQTKREIESYLLLLQREVPTVSMVLKFALLCILEEISYTRKDGQYLRWDVRAQKNLRSSSTFNKGKINEFSESIVHKLTEIIEDYELIKPHEGAGLIRLFSGSNLEVLPTIVESSYDAIFTSPPYCNRYDYTRTYALELALLGINDEQLKTLRQQMLSSTVENRSKELLDIKSEWVLPLQITRENMFLQEILEDLNKLKMSRQLNNVGIPRMVKGYFDEMSCIIFECYRLLKNNARLFMVNDNVRYSGISIPVDVILSNIAEKIGFYVEKIVVLKNGKGNSSQQMGKHGRDELRKCIYIWRK